MTALRFGLFARPSLVAFLPEPLPFLAIAIVFLSNYLASWRPYTYILMYVSSLVLVGFFVWKVHFHVSQDMFFAQAVSLRSVYAALQNDENALDEMEAFINVESSKKQLVYSGVQILLQFNVLQFLGLDLGTVIVYLSLPVAFCVTVFISPIVADAVPEVVVISCVVGFTALLSSFQVSRLQRQRFATAHALQLLLEREAETAQRVADHERRTREAAVEADTILNHMLKNIMADAAGLIWLYTATVPGAMPNDLHQALGCLDRGMQWCRRRQALVRITAGAYHLSRMPVDLRAFGEALASGRTLDCRFVDDVALLDPLLCDILLDNAINNALRHGDTARGPVVFSMALLPLGEDEAELTFTVRNWARADKPRLTPEFVAAVLRGETHSEPGNALSDHLGLQHLHLAAKAHDAKLTLQQEGDVVVLRASLAVQLESRAISISFSDPKAHTDLEGLHILCLDDSEVARRLLRHTLGPAFPACTVEVFGSTAQEVHLFVEAAVDRGDVLIVDNHLVYLPPPLSKVRRRQVPRAPTSDRSVQRWLLRVRLRAVRQQLPGGPGP
eukprot:EG_transcript_7480